MSQRRWPLAVRPGAQQLPRYVEHGGEIVVREPSEAIDARLYGFSIQADRASLDAFCARTFNEPSGDRVHWEAASRWVLLNFVDIGQLRSADVRDRTLGYSPEREVAIWVPVRDRTGRSGWAIPYMFVNDQWPMAAGRETFGFPKQLGTVTMTRDERAPAALELRVKTVPAFRADAVPRDLRVVRVTRPVAAPAPLDEVWHDQVDLLAGVVRRVAAALGNDQAVVGLVNRLLREPLRALDDIEDAGTAIVPFLADLARRRIPMVLLKQFRDAMSSADACYQAIVEVANVVTRFRKGGFLPADYSATFASLDAIPIVRELGIGADAQAPRHPFWLEFDFLIEGGGVLWTWGDDR